MAYSNPQDKITEDWYVDYEKKILIKKYHRCGALVFKCLNEPENEELLRATISALLEYIDAIPCSLQTYSYFKRALKKLQDKKLSEDEKRKILKTLKKSSVLYHKFLLSKTLRELYLVLTNHPTKDIFKIARKYGIRFVLAESAKGKEYVILNPQKIALLLNEIYEILGAVAYSAGLRLRFAEQKLAGFEKILEKEGFDESDLDLDKLLE